MHTLPRRWSGGGEPDPLLIAAAGVLDTAPIRHDPAGPLLVAGIGTRQMLPLLLAAKTLCHRLGRGRVALVDDGTLTGEDRALLAHHCGDPAIHQAREENQPFPEGLDWAALAVIVGRHQTDYRILLDLHCLTDGPTDEIAGAMNRNRSFHGLEERGLVGLAAMGAGPGEARALLARLPGERRNVPLAAHRFAHALATNETGAVALTQAADRPATVETTLAAIAALPR